MKAVILAGGYGTRLSEETHLKPKPMIEVGGKPILWHIMKIYSYHGINEFIICCGYKGYVIKEYFANYFLHMSDVTFDMGANTMEVHQKNAEPWKVTLVDTGEDSLTATRLKRVKKYLEDEEMFCMTYGDGVGSINISESIRFHKEQGRLATLAAVYPPGRFGSLAIDDNRVSKFLEKPLGDGGFINGGYFVLSNKVFDFIPCANSSWEHEPLEALVAKGELSAFLHRDFWQPMDTVRDKVFLDELWESGKAPWKCW